MKNLHIKKKSSFSKILSLLIAVVMLLTLPGFSTLADTDSTTNSTASSASSDTADTAADTTTAAAKSNTDTLVGSSDTSVSAVADGYYRIYYSQIETVSHTGSVDFSSANTAWNNINANGNVYINVGGTDTASGSVYQMSDTGLKLTSNSNTYEVYYYDIPTTTTSLYFLCENTPNPTGIKTRTNPVTLTWSSGELASYTTAVYGTSTATDVTLTSNNCFYASNPNGSDWFYQVKSTNFNPVSEIKLTNTEVATGATAKISADITPSWIKASDLIWSTENSDVADVAPGGVVTGKKDGTATITAQYGDVTASCTVTVSTTPSISIAPNPASVKIGETITFTPTINPDEYQTSEITINWSVEDTSIASVANGVVKGLREGATTVTASFTTADGKNYSASATLTVTDPSKTVSGITLTPTAATIQIGRTQQLTATVTPAGTSAVSWSSSNAKVATVDQNGLVTGHEAGTAKITATAEQAPSITATAEITVTKSTTLYYLAPVAWPGVWVYFYKDDHNKYNTSPDAAMTKLDASDYLVDGEAINTSKYALYSITVPEKNAEYAIFVSKEGPWAGADQDPTQKEGGGRPTAPDGKNGYYNGKGNAVLVTRKAPTSLSVTPAESKIASNQTVQLTATANYKGGATEDISGTVTWTSSDQSTATVSSSGLVTAVKEGSVTITATVPGSTVSGTAAITVEDADPTELSLTPSSVSLLAGTTATLTPSFKPENVNASGVKLKWTSDKESVATVDADGVVTAVSKGEATITAAVKGDNTVQAKATVTVSENAERIYYYAALSKLSYEKTPAGNVDGPRSIPVANDTVYAYAWNNSNTTGGKLITMKKLGETSGNGITYADGDIYYTDEAAGYQYIAFANGNEIQKNGALNLYGYGEGTAALPIPKDVTNPCFYAGSGDDSVYSSAVGMRPGYWASLFTVFDPAKVSKSDPVYVAKGGTKPATDSHKDDAAITYVSSTLYDYYSDYELNGKEVSTNHNTYAQGSQRNWVTFREFDQALSDYYEATGKTAWKDLAPIYTGHFQPDYLEGNLFRSVAATLNLYGWSRDNSDTYRKFMATENSGMDINGGTGMYAKASQGLVANTLAGYQDGSLGTGTLMTNDGSASLPHFNRQFLEGQNSKNAILGSVYEDVAFPFTQEKDPYYKDVSYYTFDSARESVYLRKDQATGDRYLEDVGTDAKSMNVLSDSKPNDVSTKYGYFPFNEDSTSTNAKTYDYGFGTKLEFQFRLDKNGDVTSDGGEAAPTIFKFSGDDDVWVFIDGKLVLDLGGAHGQVQGAINFSSDLSGMAQYPSKVKGVDVIAPVGANSIWVSDTKASAGTAKSYNLADLHLQDGKKHTLTFYYMERGMWESNMMIQFNMSIEKTLTVNKDWKNYDGTDLADSKKTTVYAAVKRKLLGDESEEFVNLTGSTATNGSQYVIPLTRANQWTQTFSVDEYENNAEKMDAHKYTYYVYEVQVDSAGNPVYKDNYPALYQDGQKMTLNGTTYQVSGTGEVTGAAGTITNTRQKGSGVTIKKEWSGITSEEMKPENVYVVLYEKNTNGTLTKVTQNEHNQSIGNASGVITLNSGNNWTESVEDLKASSSYIFKEVTDIYGTEAVESGGKISLTGTNDKKYDYTVSGGDVTNGSATITNTYVAPKTHVSITKKWLNENGSEIKSDDTSLPDVIYVKLKRTGESDGKEVTQYWQTDGTFTTDESSAGFVELTKSESWTKTIEGLDVYADIVNLTNWTYSLCGEMAGSENESGHLIRINAAQYVVDYGSSYMTDAKDGTLTVTNEKLPQTAVTVQKIWKNMDGQTSDEITKGHSETIRVYLKRFTEDESGKEENVRYYKVSDGVVSFTDKMDDATAIELTSENSYQKTVSGLDQYLAAVDDTGKVTTTPYYFELVSESGSWGGAAGTDATADTGSAASTDAAVGTGSAAGTDATAGTGSVASTSAAAGDTSTTAGAAGESSPATESGGKITLDGKTYLVEYGDASNAANPTVTVTNTYSPVFTLPVTGGRGRNILLGILGGAAVLAAVLYWNIRKTRRRKFRRE